MPESLLLYTWSWKVCKAGKRVKACVFLMSILLISVLFEYSEKYSMSPNMEAFDEPDEIAVSVRTGAAMRQIRIWVEEETQEAYFFLPSYASKEQIAYIADVTQSVENAIFSPDGIGSKTGLSYTELLDEDSMVMKYLLEEIVLNQANGTTSAWFYKPQNEISTKLYAGPVWDYDKAFGAFGSYRNPRLLSKLCCYRKEHTRWYEELYKKEEFLQQVKEKYAEVFRPETKAVLDGKIDRYADEIRESVAMDRIRWSVEEDFEDSVEDIKTWLGKRIEFLDEVWLQNRQFCLIRYQNEEEDICAASSVPYAGPVDENVDLSEFGEDIEHLLYWYDAENDEIYYPGSGKAVTEDIILTPVYDLSQGVDGALGAVE